MMSLQDNDIENLVSRIKNGEDEKIFELIRFCGYIPQKIMDYASALGYDKEDILQESFIALLSAVHSYDPKLGSGFRSYANICIRRRINSVLRSGNKSSAVPMINYVSIDDESELISDSDPENEWIEKEDFSETEKAVFSKLSAFECEVLKAYLYGLSIREISRKLGKNEKSVNNALMRIRRKLKFGI